MAFYVTLLVTGDPDPVFDWVRGNIPAGDVIRQIARSVNAEAIKRGAIFATCRENDPSHGWVVKIVVRSRESADRIVAFWKPRVERCEVIDFDAAVPREPRTGVWTPSPSTTENLRVPRDSRSSRVTL
jgi:hypothetical protein